MYFSFPKVRVMLVNIIHSILLDSFLCLGTYTYSNYTNIAPTANDKCWKIIISSNK